MGYLMKLAPLVSVVRSRTTSAGALIPFSMTTISPTLRAELATLTSPRSVSFMYLPPQMKVERQVKVLIKHLAIFFSIFQQEVSVDIIQNSAAGNFSPKTEGTKTKAGR
jgi:hypothetical protein